MYLTEHADDGVDSVDVDYRVDDEKNHLGENALQPQDDGLGEPQDVVLGLLQQQ